MSSTTKPVIWSYDTGKRIPCFETCQVSITSMSKFEDARCLGWPISRGGRHVVLRRRRRRTSHASASNALQDHEQLKE